MSYQCPLCHLALTPSVGGVSCENNHQFDRAKEGYVNLMPVQHKRSKEPGDNVDMMQARRRFLGTEHYDVLREAVAALCIKYTEQTPRQVLDIGCGEGYYTAYLAEQLSALSSCSTCYGLDISKVAIRYAAKRYTSSHLQFCVASSQRLPFADHSLDAVVRIYAPCEASELARVLSRQGVIITVTPAARHLYQLKELIYDNVHLHDEAAEIIEGFELTAETTLNYPMTLTGAEADDLLQMTPLAWKASAELRGQLQAASEWIFEADFMLRVYQRVIPI